MGDPVSGGAAPSVIEHRGPVFVVPPPTGQVNGRILFLGDNGEGIARGGEQMADLKFMKGTRLPKATVDNLASRLRRVTTSPRPSGVR